MIISHKHKFIFIKTHKTASTSIEIALSSICGAQDVITQLSPQSIREKYGLVEKQNTNVALNRYSYLEFFNALITRKKKKFHQHMTCKEVKKSVSKSVWNSYYKFSIERNPFDRMVSLYYWRDADKKYSSILQFLKGVNFNNTDSFNKYTIDGKVAVDKVYQYEDLDYFLADFSKKIGLEKPLKLPNYHAKSDTRKVNDYKQILDHESREFIEKRFKRVIDLFGYHY
jgi:hypothetical protein